MPSRGPDPPLSLHARHPGKTKPGVDIGPPDGRIYGYSSSDPSIWGLRCSVSVSIPHLETRSGVLPFPSAYG